MVTHSRDNFKVGSTYMSNFISQRVYIFVVVLIMFVQETHAGSRLMEETAMLSLILNHSICSIYLYGVVKRDYKVSHQIP